MTNHDLAMSYFVNVMIIYHVIMQLVYLLQKAPRWKRSRLERSLRTRKVGRLNPSRDRPKSLKQVVTVPLLNAQQQV